MAASDMRRRTLLIAAGACVLAACQRESPNPRPPAPGPARPPDAAFGEVIRMYDRDVMDVLRRLPTTSLTPDEARARERGTTLVPPASAADLEALERRIGKPLPPSYRAFLTTTDGMMFEGFLNQVMLLRASEVKPLTASEFPGIGVWFSMPDAAVPLAPEAGGPLPGSALRRAWMISSVEDGDTYFIFPELEGSDGEWPVWFFGPKNPGAYGYRSFRAMLERERDAALRNLSQRRQVR